MRDVSIVEPADEVEFDAIITEVIEQPSAASEQDLNQVDLHLVDLPGAEKLPALAFTGHGGFTSWSLPGQKIPRPLASPRP